MNTAPPQDIAAEEALLGGFLLAGTIPPAVLDTGLKPEHFYRYPGVYRDALVLHDKGQAIDSITLDSGDHFAGAVPDLGNLAAYAKRVVDKARWRSRREAGLMLMEAATKEDEGKVATAERLLTAPQEHGRVFHRERLQDLIVAGIEKPAPPGWQMPFFNARIKRGTFHIWGGWTSHGKTVWVDQIARELHRQDAKVWAWLNEMTAKERIDRFVSSHANIPLQRVEAGLLHKGEHERVVEAIKYIPFEIVECPGWTEADICRDIRVRKPDVAIVDIIHNIPYETERDLARICLAFANTAKLADCCVIGTVHLNRAGVVGNQRPHPMMHHIKGASAFEQLADLVGMAWREDSPDTGRPTNKGQLYTLKVRQGKPDGHAVAFDGERALFELDEWA